VAIGFDLDAARPEIREQAVALHRRRWVEEVCAEQPLQRVE
jgi:hypothetical protein